MKASTHIQKPPSHELWSERVNEQTNEHSGARERVILKKVSFGIFSIILVLKEEKSLTMKSKDEVQSLSKFSCYLVIVNIIKIRHLKGHTLFFL